MTCSKGFFKRMVPFVATFAVGVFIASFFVSISAPNFRSGRGGKRHHEMKRLRVENEQLKNENLRLRNEMESRQWNAPHAMHLGHEDWNNPGVEFPVPLPPPPPVAPRAKR